MLWYEYAICRYSRFSIDDIMIRRHGYTARSIGLQTTYDTKLRVVTCQLLLVLLLIIIMIMLLLPLTIIIIITSQH